MHCLDTEGGDCHGSGHCGCSCNPCRVARHDEARRRKNGEEPDEASDEES